jgi:hypothetical protein
MRTGILGNRWVATIGYMNAFGLYTAASATIAG